MICPGCGCVFCPPPQPPRATPQRYCLPGCAAQARTGPRLGLPVCPAAKKISYPSPGDARAAMTDAAVNGHGGHTDIYPCPPDLPDHWHTTSEPRLPVRVTVRGQRTTDSGRLLRQLRGW